VCSPSGGGAQKRKNSPCCTKKGKDRLRVGNKEGEKSFPREAEKKEKKGELRKREGESQGQYKKAKKGKMRRGVVEEEEKRALPLHQRKEILLVGDKGAFALAALGGREFRRGDKEGRGESHPSR